MLQDIGTRITIKTIKLILWGKNDLVMPAPTFLGSPCLVIPFVQTVRDRGDLDISRRHRRRMGTS